MMKKIDFKGLDLEVFHKKLKNGLNVYFIPYKYKSNYYMSFATKFGSVNKDFAPVGSKEIKSYPLGIAHFLEHKMFESEDGIDPFTFFNASGTDANANTNYNLTQYICYGNNNIEDNLKYLLKYVSEPYFTDQNVEKEKGIITQEIEMYDDEADWTIDEELRKSIFKIHPIRDDIAGTVEEINKITKEDLYDCYNTFYCPSNMLLFVSGKIPIEELEKIVDQYDIEHPVKKSKLKLKKYDEPKEINKKEINIEKNIVVPKVAYGIKVPIDNIDCTNLININMYINMFLNLKFGISSKFREDMRKKNLMTSLYAESEIVDDFITISIFAESNNSHKFIKELKKELTTFDITEKDVERVKKVWTSSEVQMSDNIEVTVDNLIYDILRFKDIIPNKISIIKKLNFNDLQKVISSINLDNSSVVYMNPKNN